MVFDYNLPGRFSFSRIRGGSRKWILMSNPIVKGTPGGKHYNRVVFYLMGKYAIQRKIALQQVRSLIRYGL